MSLQSFGISNFKAFGPSLQRMPLKPITLIFGANSVGKSSLLHSLLWTSEVATQGVFDIRTSGRVSGNLDLGGFQSVIRNHDTTQKITVSIQPLEIAGGESVEISFGIGIRQWEDDVEEYWKIINSDPDTVTFLKENKVYRKSADILNKCFKFLYYEDYEGPFNYDMVAAALSSPTAWEAQANQQLQERREAGRPEFIFPAFDQAREAFDEGQKAWAIARDLAPVVLPRLKKVYEDFESFRLVHSKECSVIACEVRAGGELVLKAVRQLASDSLTVDPDSVKASFWEQLPTVEISSQTPDRHRHNISRHVLGSLKFSGESLSAETGELDHVVRSIAIPWLLTQQENFLKLAEQLIMIGPLRALPARRELLGFPGESTTNPLLMPWQRLRDDEAIRELINKHLRSLTGSNLSFLRLTYARIERVTQIIDKLPKRPERVNMAGEIRRPTDWSKAMFVDGYSCDWDETSLEKHGPFYEDLKDDDPYAADGLIEQDLTRHNPNEILVDLALIDGSGVAHTMQDVGVGISQIAPVLVQSLGNCNRVIAIEQPEIHIHPKLQAELADVFIESALGENKNTFLLETHSEHLILRILRRIRETTRGKLPDGYFPITPDDVAVLYVEPGEEGSVVRELRVNDQGRFIDDWPNGFFEERFNEEF